jgi:alkylation response protein AidB-like acyl-CoA dehydrogenase
VAWWRDWQSRLARKRWVGIHWPAEQGQWWWSGAASIAGVTSEAQKNIVAERILGLLRG